MAPSTLRSRRGRLLHRSRAGSRAREVPARTNLLEPALGVVATPRGRGRRSTSRGRQARRRAFVGAAGTVLLLGAAAGAVAEDGATSLAEVEEQIFVAVNEYRESQRLAALTLDGEVSALARAHSEAMARGEADFGHQGFNTRTGKIMQHLTVKAVAENISKHSRKPSEVSEKAMANWLSSDVHRNNIENRHQVTGIGAAVSEDGTVYVTQIFVRTR